MSKALTLNTTTNASMGPNSFNTQTAHGTWPNYWHIPTYPITYSYPTPPAEEYANEVEVEQHEHDATLRFYRRNGKGKWNRSLVKEITVPLGVLEWMQGADD